MLHHFQDLDTLILHFRGSPCVLHTVQMTNMHTCSVAGLALQFSLLRMVKAGPTLILAQIFPLPLYF